MSLKPHFKAVPHHSVTNRADRTMSDIILFAILVTIVSQSNGLRLPTLEMIEENLLKELQCELKDQPDSIFGLELRVSFAAMANRNAVQTMDKIEHVLTLIEQKTAADDSVLEMQIKELKEEIASSQIASMKVHDGLQGAWNHLRLERKANQWTWDDFLRWHEALKKDVQQLYTESLNAIEMVLGMEGTSGINPADLSPNDTRLETITKDGREKNQEVADFAQRWIGRLHPVVFRLQYISKILSDIENELTQIVDDDEPMMENTFIILSAIENGMHNHREKLSSMHFLHALLRFRDDASKIKATFRAQQQQISTAQQGAANA